MAGYAFSLTAAGHDVSDQPRDSHGRFGEGGSEPAPGDTVEVGGVAIALKGRPDGKGTPDDPIYVGKDINRAVELLAEDKSIRLDDTKTASIVVARVGEYAAELKAATGTAPDFDLCNVSVGDTNLFCAGTLGLPRAEMPQLSGVARDGSPAAEKRTDPSNSDEKVDITAEYTQALRDSDVPVVDKTVDAAMLRATQNEINGGKTGKILNDLIAGDTKRYDANRIWITKDGYVLDGHHRWVAGIAESLLVGGDGGQVKVHEVGMDIGAALDFTKAYAKEQGIKQAKVSDFRSFVLTFGSARVRFDFHRQDT